MAENDSITLDTLQEQREQILTTVNNLTAQKAQLEEQLTAVKNAISTNQGALQYSNALITSLTSEEDAPADGESDNGTVVLPTPEETEDESVSL